MNLRDIIIRCIFPRRCVFCNAVLDINYEFYICHDCEKTVSWINGNVCEKCGKPIEHYGRCRRCNSMEHKFDTAYAVYVYEDEVRKAVHRFKYKNKGSYARFFGHELARFADFEDIPPVDYVVPVPIARARLHERGYNQCALMADEYCKLRNETRADLLERVRKTKPQSGLKREERVKNIRGAFAVKDCGINLKGKSILLIDDIFTTGSTVDECAKVLKRAGVGAVYVLCLSISEAD